MTILTYILLLFFTPSLLLGQNENYPVKIGSKKFTESVILGEIAYQLARTVNTNVVHKKEIGGTRVLWDALLKGDIDIYPEYTGTIRQEILSGENVKNDSDMIRMLNSKNIRMSKSLGFSDNYAIGMKKSQADKLNINTISDLRNHPELKFGFSNEFIDRKDGWPGLQQAYQLPQKNVTGLDHDLAYRGLQQGSIDVVDFYSTDAEIKYYDLKVLNDDFHYFPEYKAVFLYRKDLEKETPAVLSKILMLEGSIPDSTMTRLNADVKINGMTESAAAEIFIKEKFGIIQQIDQETLWSNLWKNTRDHLFLVIVSLFAAIIISIPLGVIAYKSKKSSRTILGVVGVIQTIPSLALLVFMIPLLGIGSWPAILALFLYSLLPIVRNTYTGLEGIPVHIKESAEVLGLTPFAKLRLIELPIALPSILAGIKTSAVINVGTATLGALIGAGGYGQPILTGIRLDNVSLILQGAVPAAILALIVQSLFDLLERIFVPRGLKL
ncbi:MAG TPA: glycine betaine ABC transporter substrate-binding protein [Ignavibacteriaceae bacterium]|nr:glycine betaine ABC transporter substrate-binding protein [Ignavibacteriaceae bacterium]